MTKRSKRQNANGGRGSTQRPAVMTQSQIEAYLLSREILRRIQRSSTLFNEVPGTNLASRHCLH